MDYKDLRVWSEMFEDAQKARIACTNRIERGGVDRDHYASQLEAMCDAEHKVELAMKRCFRKVADSDIVAWQKSTLGVGEHMLAHLLGVIGHPRYTTLHHWEGDGKATRVLIDDGPMERMVSQLWSYCGHGDPDRRRRAGMSKEEAFALGSPRAKMIVHQIAEASMKCMASPYRKVYDDARERYADRVHANDCPQCHAKVGDPWKPGHQHAAALRLVGKEMLKDLWIVSGNMSTAAQATRAA